jgi:hypothetical protein
MAKISKRELLIILVIAFFVATLLFKFAIAKIGDLRCADISGCYSNAGCGEPGKVVGTCIIECESGAIIICPTI